jgi:hypothetical protein
MDNMVDSSDLSLVLLNEGTCQKVNREDWKMTSAPALWRAAV